MSEEPTFITFVRHGQSLSNLAQRWQGQGDSPLSELGKRQAELLGSRLGGRRFTRVISSDLTRAADTARATGLAFETRAELREFDVGCWEGLTREEVEERYPDELERLKRGEDIPLGGGESYATFSARVDAALATFRAELEPGDHALVVCHGGVIATVLAGALGLRRGGHWSLARVANTSITGLSYVSGHARLDVFNDTLHLLPLGSWPLHPDTLGVVGLVCDALDGDCFGDFAARYDAAELLHALGADASRDAWIGALSARLLELQERHPDGRVALSAHAHSIHAWAESALWRGDLVLGALSPPSAGSISHVGRVGERTLLLDYGIRVLPER